MSGCLVQVGTIESRGLVHAVLRNVLGSAVDGFVTYCGWFVSHKDMHNRPKLVTCLVCIVTNVDPLQAVRDASNR